MANICKRGQICDEITVDVLKIIIDYITLRFMLDICRLLCLIAFGIIQWLVLGN